MYRILGAEFFQKVVLRVERIKFNLVKKVFPNGKLVIIYDKLINLIRDWKLKRAKTDEQRQAIIEHYKHLKLSVKRQIVSERNDNYHLRLDDVEDLAQKLNYNRLVHQKGLLRNLVFMLILIGFLIVNKVFLASFILRLLLTIDLCFNAACAVINFECVNLQKYNLIRYNKRKERLERINKRKLGKMAKKFGEANRLIANTYYSAQDVPSPDMVIANVSSLSALEELERLLTISSTESYQDNDEKTMDKGGKTHVIRNN